MVLNSGGSAEPLPEIPGYRIVRLIGSGGMGQVYLAVQLSLNRSVVIKVLSSVDGSSEEDWAARFEREAALMVQGSHPNVVGIIDRGNTGGTLYIVMEYIEGGDLRSRLRRGRPMSIRQARPILAAIGRGLTALHERGIIHRDLKPENVLLDQDGTVRIADFGIAACLDQVGDLTNENISPGTLDYMAPEQRHRLGIDARVDQYALAFVAYEMLVGRRPLGIVGSPSDRNPDLTKNVDDVILCGLQEDPDDRFPTVTDFSKSLDRSLAERCTAQGAVGAALRRFRCSLSRLAGVSAGHDLGRSPRRMAVFGVLGLLAAIAVAGLLAQRSSEGDADPRTVRPSVSDELEFIEQTGALGYRIRDGVLQVLLIRSRHDHHWTIPKAGQDHQTTVRETVEREAFAEGGFRGIVLSSPVGTYDYAKKGDSYRVTVFPVLVEEELSEWPEQFRKREWCSVETVADLDAAEGLRDLVRDFRPDNP